MLKENGYSEKDQEQKDCQREDEKPEAESGTCTDAQCEQSSECTQQTTEVDLPQLLEEERQRAAQAEERAKEWYNQYLRLSADFDNYRKRMQREQQEAANAGKRELIGKLLTVLDNFERAMGSLEQSENDEMLAGIKLIYRQFSDILRSEGLEPLNPQGEPFNPQYHEAVMREKNEELCEDIVIEVFQKGYLFKGKLLRPAMVKVSHK